MNHLQRGMQDTRGRIEGRRNFLSADAVRFQRDRGEQPEHDEKAQNDGVEHARVQTVLPRRRGRHEDGGTVLTVIHDRPRSNIGSIECVTGGIMNACRMRVE